MKTILKYSGWLVLVCLLALHWGCQKELLGDSTSYQLQLKFEHAVGSSTLQLGNTYQNTFGETYTLTAFKYYISNILLQKADGTTEPVAGYFLVDEANAASKTITLQVQHNQYTRLQFLLGVDSTRNVSGTQSGDLDPAKGMFWTWNSGYIMAKVEGNSPASAQPANKVEWHIGGFKTAESVLRQVTIGLPPNSLAIKANSSSQVVIEANLDAWFNSVHPLDIATHPVCTSPGPLAQRFADNYANMFTLQQVINN